LPGWPAVGAWARAYEAAISVVRGYLAVWREQGRAAASDQFLVPSERGGGNDVALRVGKVISYQPGRWVSADHFRLLVILDLHFDGPQGAWDIGRNGRFITFTRSTGQKHYLMFFATSP
jgi:hypothetical protein